MSTFNDLYYNTWDFATSSSTTTTFRGQNGNIYIGGGTVPVATTDWTLTVDPNRYWGDPLWREPSVLYRDGDGIRRVSNEGMPIPESDMNWLKRRVSEISWVPA